MKSRSILLLSLLAGVLAGVLAGCGAIMRQASSELAADLGAAIQSHDDPETVAAALPAWMLLLEALLRSQPDNADLLFDTARLYSVYSGLFVAEPERQKRLADRALSYARRGLCVEDETLCAALDRPYLDFEPIVLATGQADIEAAYRYATVWAGWVQAYSAAYDALADLPKVELLLRRVVDLAPALDDGAPYLYLAVLNSQRPAAVGGDLDGARRYYRLAVERSAGHNLLIKVYYAEQYARMVFDRELHDCLLHEVLDAKVDIPEFKLTNQLAKARAKQLLEEADAFF